MTESREACEEESWEECGRGEREEGDESVN